MSHEAMAGKQRTARRGLRRTAAVHRQPREDGEKFVWTYAGVREWQAELSISRLFRTSIRLQTVFDRCFSHFGLTAQEAAVLVHCAGEGETSAGKLAKAMGRDKGKITRFVDRLEAGGFLTRKSDLHDRRLFIIRATNKGRRVAPQLKARFDEMRSQFFQGIANVDIDQFETVLSRLDENAQRLSEQKLPKTAGP